MRRNLVNVFDLRELTDLIASCSLSETLLHIYRIFKCGCGKCNKLQDTGATGRMIYILPRAETDSAKWQKARKAKLIAALNGIERTCKDNQAQKGSQPRSQCSQTAAILSLSLFLSLSPLVVVLPRPQSANRRAHGIGKGSCQMDINHMQNSLQFAFPSTRCALGEKLVLLVCKINRKCKLNIH